MKNTDWYYKIWDIHNKYISIKDFNSDYFKVVLNLWITFYSICNRSSKYALFGGALHDSLIQLEDYKVWFERFRALYLLDQYGLPQDCVKNTYDKLISEFEEMFGIKWNVFRDYTEIALRKTQLRKYNVFDQEKPGRPTNDLIDITLIALDKAFPDGSKRGDLNTKYATISDIMNFLSLIPTGIKGYDKLIPTTKTAVRHRIERIQLAGGNVERRIKINKAVEDQLKIYLKKKREIAPLVKKGLKKKEVKRGQ